MLTLTVGVDVGNSAVKVCAEDQRPFQFPTVMDTVAHATAWEEVEEPLEHLDFEVVDSKSIPAGRAFYGSLAANTGTGRSMPVRSNKATDVQALRSLLCGIAAAACRRLDGMRVRERKQLVDPATGAIPIRVHLGSALPMDTWRDDDLRKQYRRQIRGQHRVRFVSTPRWSQYGPLDLQIGEMTVAGEGMVVLYNLALSGVDEAALMDGTVCVSDVGANSHDMPVHRQGRLQNTLSNGFDSRLAEQLEAMRQQVQAQHGVLPTRAALEEAILRRGMQLPFGTLRPLDIRPIVEPRLQTLAELYTERIWRCLETSNYLLTDVVMAGGGSALVRPYLETALARKAQPRPLPFRLHWPEQAVFSNALGCLRLIRDHVARQAVS